MVAITTSAMLTGTLQAGPIAALTFDGTPAEAAQKTGLPRYSLVDYGSITTVEVNSTGTSTIEAGDPCASQ